MATSAEIQQCAKVHVQSGDYICNIFWDQPDVEFELGFTTDLKDTLSRFLRTCEPKLKGKQVEYFVMVRPTKN